MSAAVTLQAKALQLPSDDLERTETYQQMRAEVAKLDATGDDVDWCAIEATARRVLCELGQDLRAAAYWTHARHVLGGAACLAEGVILVAALLNDAWTQLSPPLNRLRARAGALQWLVTRTEAHLAAGPSALAPDAAAQLVAAVDALASAARHRLGERAPAFAELRRWIAQAAATGVPPTASATTTPGWTPPADAPASKAASMPLPTPSALGRQLCAVAEELRAANAADPEAYRLLRTGLWLHLGEPPPAVAGRTRIAPLPAELRDSLHRLAEARAWPALLAGVEKHALDHRLCLDLQRWAAQALTGLGTPYRACLQAVEAQVRALLARLPTLVALQSRDAQPLADAATLKWLDELNLSGPPQPAGVTTPSRPGVRATTADVTVAGGAKPAIDALVEDDVDGIAPGPRVAFVRLLAQAERCLSAGQRRVAGAQFEVLCGRLRRRRLWAWEPELSARVLRGFLQCSDAEQARGQSAHDALRRLATLDVEGAVRLVEKLS